jgi:hypothetical protein
MPQECVKLDGEHFDSESEAAEEVERRLRALGATNIMVGDIRSVPRTVYDWYVWVHYDSSKVG